MVLYIFHQKKSPIKATHAYLLIELIHSILDSGTIDSSSKRKIKMEFQALKAANIRFH